MSNSTLAGGMAFASGLVFPLGAIGSIVAYESSPRREPEPKSPQPPALASLRPRIQPLLSISPRGAYLGLGGIF